MVSSDLGSLEDIACIDWGLDVQYSHKTGLALWQLN
jgi:hypothetical protein